MSSQKTENSASRPPGICGIADMAAEFDITPRTIRFYEDKGLISPSREGGVRLFNEKDKLRLEQILRAKRMGFSLDDIREVFDVMDGEVRERAELVRRKGNFERVIASLDRRRSDIEILRDSLTELCTRIQTYLDNPKQGADILRFASAYDAALRPHMDDFYDEAIDATQSASQSATQGSIAK